MAYPSWSEHFNKTLTSVCAYNFSKISFAEENESLQCTYLKNLKKNKHNYQEKEIHRCINWCFSYAFLLNYWTMLNNCCHTIPFLTHHTFYPLLFTPLSGQTRTYNSPHVVLFWTSIQNYPHLIPFQEIMIFLNIHNIFFKFALYACDTWA